MKTIKIIDLFNKIANGEEVPKRIKVNDIEFEIYTESPNIDYQLANGQSTYLFQDYIHSFGEIKFNDEVEILDEEDEFENIEEIEHEYIYGLNENEEKIDDRVSRFEDKINSLIKNQKKIIERLNEKKY